MFPTKVARTYLGRRRREVEPEASKKVKEQRIFINLDSTGDYSFPIDPFDKLTTKDVAQRVQLKELEKIHASFNLDSSVEMSQSDDITGPDRSSTPLKNSFDKRKTQELDYSNLFESPILDKTSIYTRFVPSEPSSNSVNASKAEVLDSIGNGITATPTAHLKKNVMKLSLAKQRKHVKIKEKSLEISPVAKNKSAQTLDNVSKPKVLSPISAINQNSDQITKEHKNVRKLSLTKTRNVFFKEKIIEISEDSANYDMPELNNVRLSKQKRKTKSSNAKLVDDNVASLRKSTRLSSRKSEKISKEPVLVPSETNNGCDKIILAGGKWRKSLNAWKRRTLENQTNNLDSRSSQMNHHHHRKSIKILDGAQQRDLQTIVEHLQNSLSESPIVLQETDDGLSNLSGLSLRDESDSGKNILRQRSLIYENQFNEESDNKSYKQSLLRKRCTSVIEPPTFDHHLDITTCVTAIDIVKKLNPKEIVLRRCRQTAPLKFSEIYSEQNLHNCRKIGEGVYGEVFMNKTACGNTAVLKIIPIEGEIEVNGEPQKKFDEILAEIVIAMELSNLRNGKDFMTNGFVEVINVRCVQGRYPEHLVDLWELYRDNHVTENDHPDLFNDDQLFIVLELSNAGQDLEAFTFSNALQSYSAFIQIAITLAVAEAKFQFEHRDLHWGNVLLIPTDDKEITFKLNGKETKIPTHGVKATIIDYTLSRMVFEGCCLYNDLSNDDELFAASGDYQFDIYRFMKNHLGNKWDRYEPYTNILWLHYTIDKMINGARYRNNKNKKHRSAIQDMMTLRDELLDYKNSCDYIKCLC